MIRQKKQSSKEIIIDLTGPNGNAFVLMGIAANLAGQFFLNKDHIISEMSSGDYEHLVQVFDKYFGEYVILER